MAGKLVKPRTQVLKDSRRKGLLVGGAAIATGVATATVGFLPLGVVGLGATGVFAYRWMKHRMRNGIRF